MKRLVKDGPRSSAGTKKSRREWAGRDERKELSRVGGRVCCKGNLGAVRVEFDDGWFPKVEREGLSTKTPKRQLGESYNEEGEQPNAGVYVRLDGSDPQNKICFLDQRLDGWKRVGTHCKHKAVVNELLESVVAIDMYCNILRSWCRSRPARPFPVDAKTKCPVSLAEIDADKETCTMAVSKYRIPVNFTSSLARLSKPNRLVPASTRTTGEVA